MVWTTEHRALEGANGMLSQEEYMDVLALKRQGWTNAEIAHELGYHPATISSRLRNEGPRRAWR